MIPLRELNTLIRILTAMKTDGVGLGWNRRLVVTLQKPYGGGWTTLATAKLQDNEISVEC